MSELRPSQQRIMRYTGGKMGISAVPGSGKTFTLSRLAFELVSKGPQQDDQEVLVVTFTNAAVGNFTAKIGELVSNAGLTPNVGYRVCTLHSLAHEIVRERPDLVGLSEQFTIIDEHDRDEVLSSKVNLWIKTNDGFLDEWSARSEDGSRILVSPDKWSDLLLKVAIAFIRTCKDLQASPELLARKMAEARTNHSLLDFGLSIYKSYQKELAARHAVDFDDLISLALHSIRSDPDYLRRLRYRWPYILEDEAQDSSLLQQGILGELCGPDGNWVRVGDPNQAIYQTFTTASPEHLRNFLNERDVCREELPISGRFSQQVRTLANELILWNSDHLQDKDLGGALSIPLIDPPLPGDQQYTNASRAGSVIVNNEQFAPEEEVDFILKSLKKWLPEHPDKTVAILAHRNDRGEKFTRKLNDAKIKCLELLSSNQSTRLTADTLATVLRYLAKPDGAVKLEAVFSAIHKKEIDAAETQPTYQQASRLLRKCERIEDYLAPIPGRDWMESLPSNVPETVCQVLRQFQQQIIRWQDASLLPIDQLLLTVAQDLFIQVGQPVKDPSEEIPNRVDLALAHQLALVMERRAETHPNWRLMEFESDMRETARGSLSLRGFQDEDIGFEPKNHPGEVVVTTIHKAKGLEWDRVYFTSANNYDFPSGEVNDSFYSEKWFVRGKLNLQAEALSKLNALLGPQIDLPGVFLEDGVATLQFRNQTCAERVRLFYVAVTRACEDLRVTMNTGDRENQQPALLLVAMKQKMQEKST